MRFEFTVSHKEPEGGVAFPHGTDFSTHLGAAAEKPRLLMMAFLYDAYKACVYHILVDAVA